MVNDGKFICKRFFSNFEKLKREVESEEAFFFNDDGVYCQVGTSIFDRWEQVTLIDPEWDKAIDDDEKRVRLHRKYEAERLSQQAPKKPPKYCYLPAPIPDGKKPQDDLKYVYLSQDEDGNECKATWHSRTVEIDYGEFQCIELQAPFNLGSLAVGVRCCSLCAVEYISRRSCPSLGRNQGRGAEIARP